MFCGVCLRNRYGQDARKALKDPDWWCPPCKYPKYNALTYCLRNTQWQMENIRTYQYGITGYRVSRPGIQN